MKDLKGKNAFITGGASGMGLGLAKACAEEGMNVVIADMRQHAIDEALAMFKEKGWPAHGVKLNIADRAGFAKAADEAEARFGNIHLLANHAGITGIRAPLWEVSFEDTDMILDINLFGALNGIQTIVPRMLKHGEESHIVSTASKNALVPVDRHGLYNLAKRAIVAMTETMAIDLQGTNIGMSVFCPGPFATNFSGSTGEVVAELTGTEYVASPPPKLESAGAGPRSPDEAGKRIIRGIKRGDLYILTHSEFKRGFKARADAILRAFPDEPPSEEFQKTFSFLVYNDIFEKQTDVPAFEG